MAYHVIYIPGLGDRRSLGQVAGLQLWRLFGLVPHYLPLGWITPESFNRKLSRILTLADRLVSQGHQVSLVGVSAGASAALAAYAERPRLLGLVLICGKVQRPNTVSPATYARNPDFRQSMQRVAPSLTALRQANLTGNILSIHPLRDKTVPPADTRIEDAAELTIPAVGHYMGIAMGILAGGPVIARFLRSRASGT